MQTRNCTWCKNKEEVSKMAQFRSRWFCKIVRPGEEQSCLDKVRKKKARSTI